MARFGFAVAAETLTLEIEQLFNCPCWITVNAGAPHLHMKVNAGLPVTVNPDAKRVTIDALACAIYADVVAFAQRDNGGHASQRVA
jgi:hypothetical protein